MFSNFIYSRSHSDKLSGDPLEWRKKTFFAILINGILAVTASMVWVLPENIITEWMFWLPVWAIIVLYGLLTLLSVVILGVGAYQNYVHEEDVSTMLSYSPGRDAYWAARLTNLYVLVTLWYFDWTITLYTFLILTVLMQVAVFIMRVWWRRVTLGPVFS